MVTIAEVFTSREATIFYVFSFTFAFFGIYFVQRKRMLNFFQRYGICLLMVGMILRIVSLTFDYTHMIISG